MAHKIPNPCQFPSREFGKTKMDFNFGIWCGEQASNIEYGEVLRMVSGMDDASDLEMRDAFFCNEPFQSFEVTIYGLQAE